MGGVTVGTDGAYRMVKRFSGPVGVGVTRLVQTVVEPSRDTDRHPVVRSPLRGDHVPEARDLERRGQMVGLVCHVHGYLGGRACGQEREVGVAGRAPSQALDPERPVVQEQGRRILAKALRPVAGQVYPRMPPDLVNKRCAGSFRTVQVRHFPGEAGIQVGELLCNPWQDESAGICGRQSPVSTANLRWFWPGPG